MEEGIEKHICIRIWGEELLVSMKVFWNKSHLAFALGYFCSVEFAFGSVRTKKKGIFGYMDQQSCIGNQFVNLPG